MAAPPDVKTLKKWEDAFQHPIPTVRVLERQLQTELSSNKEKLRGLVGESYRDLLRTAERIIEMDGSAQKVEVYLAETSRNCNSRLLERKARNLKIFEERVGAADREKYIFAAQLAVLQSCPSVVSRLLLKDDGSSCLLATKVFVVSRLLLKSLLQKGSVPLLESLKQQRTSLNTILINHIDLLLSTVSVSTPHLTSVFTSFSLLKTSSPAEALRHFLFVRSSAITSLVEDPSPESYLKALTLYNQTLENAESVFPKRLSDSLVVLKSRSLFQDPDVLGVTELGLDVNGRWLPEEISGFIPWVRHDDLERGRMVEQVSAWAERELETLNVNLEKSLAHIEKVDKIVRLRSDVLNLWRAGRKGRRQFLQGGEKFRDLVGARIGSVLRGKSSALKEVGEKVQEVLKGVGEAEDSTSLWSNVLLSMDLSNGGLAFKEAVQSRVHGKNNLVKVFREEYNIWLRDIAESALIVRGLRNPSSSSGTDDDDDFDVEEEKLQEGLEDSVAAEKEMVGALEGDYKDLERIIDQLVDGCGEKDGEGQRAVTLRATFLLRVIRQIRQHPPKREEDILLNLNWFGIFLIPRLHSLVATGVGKKPFESVGKLLNKRKWSGKLASKALWEGAPPLPVQPSPLVFKFLHDLVTDMHSVGDDVWTPAAVKYIKILACQELWRALESVLSGREIAETNGNGNGNGGGGGGGGGGGNENGSGNANGNGNANETTHVDEKKEVQETIEAVASVETNESRDVEKNKNHDVEEKIEGDEAMEVNEEDETPQANGEEEDKQDEGVVKDDSETKEEDCGTEQKETQPNGGGNHHKIIGMDWAVQLLFDALYLDEALQRKGSNTRNSGVSSLAGKIEAAVGIRLGFDEELRRRLEGGSREYWKRTCLLFGLLS